MSVVAAQAQVPAVAAAPAVPYGMYGGGGAKKRKDVVQQEEEEEEGRCGEGDAAARPRRRLHGAGHGLFVLETVEEDDEEDRSSIGAVSHDDGHDQVESKQETPPSPWPRKKMGALKCLDALDDALPIKRGLSNFFSGKSRSFANLQDVAAGGTSAAARDVLGKPENPFNKRRRILRCTSICRVSSSSLTALPPFLLPCSDDVDEDDDASHAIAGGGGSG